VAVPQPPRARDGATAPASAAPLAECRRENLALLTDLYQLTMLQAYLEEGLHETAVFSLFARRLPPPRNFLLACGLADALALLETLTFERPWLDRLDALGLLSERTLRWLEAFRFSGDVHAVPEGTPVFGQEPLLEVEAPLPEAQIVETIVLNQVHFQTVAASKAARVVLAAGGRPVVDFGLRRMHGTDAGLKAVRAFFVAGVHATSNVLGGLAYGVPVRGTMAHSYVQAHESELEAFRAFVRTWPDAVLLVDTYDTAAGVANVVHLSRELGRDFRVRGVRLDSGDLGALAKQARALLDEAGLGNVEIFASGGLDEREVASLVAAGAPIDAFGVGTALGVSADAPALDMAYKLVHYAGKDRLKLSAGKALLPGRKQVFRVEPAGLAEKDVLGRREERGPGRPLLRPVMREGRSLPEGRVGPHAARAHAARALASLPVRLRGLEPAMPPYPVEISDALGAARARAVEERRPS
jgi:nicotinate phosphoribosyltransferase